MRKKKRQIEEVSVRQFGKTSDLVFSIIIGLLALTSIIPFVFVIIISLTSETSLTIHGYTFFPRELSFDGYKYLWEFRAPLITALKNTLFITVIGTLLNTTVSSTYAYAISRPNFKYRRFFTLFILSSMLFSSGLVPGYIVVTQLLGLKDSLWALIIPAAFSPFNVIIMRTFFRKTISDSIIESARIDGAGEFLIFRKIVVPLAIPGIATISLFSALGFWNDWFGALLYLNDKNKYPLQYLLMQIQSNLEYISKNAGQAGLDAQMSLPKEATRMAMVVISTLPIALSYPFFQKHFVSGLTIGGVKG